MSSKQETPFNKTWTKEEDQKLLDLIPNGSDKRLNWKELCKNFGTKSYKQCREHYFNKLRKGLVFGNWTREEDLLIIDYQRRYGNKWSLISSKLKGRSSNAVKNRFFGHIKKFNLIDDPYVPGDIVQRSCNETPIIKSLSMFTPCDASTYIVTFY